MSALQAAAVESKAGSSNSAPAAAQYQPKVILLTGGAGFIGSHVLCDLVTRYPNVRVICLDKLIYCASVHNFDDVKKCPNFEFVQGDVCSSDLVNHLIKAHQVDTIMHFAAQTHVDNSFANSLEFTKTNVLGTHVLLESAKLYKHQVKRFIHVSTDEVYGEALETAERSTAVSPLNPTNPYAATKVAAEFLVNSYRLSFGLPTIITRGNNVYGPRQYPEKLIPKFILLLSQRKPCPLHGDGNNRRSFLHVSDVARAFDVILTKGRVGDIYNIGSREEISNKDVLKKLIKVFKLDAEEDKYISFVKDRAFNDLRYHIDSSSLENLGWRASVDFETGLAQTVAWYLAHSSHWGDDISRALTAHPHFPENMPHDIADSAAELEAASPTAAATATATATATAGESNGSSSASLQPAGGAPATDDKRTAASPNGAAEHPHAHSNCGPAASSGSIAGTGAAAAVPPANALSGPAVRAGVLSTAHDR